MVKGRQKCCKVLFVICLPTSDFLPHSLWRILWYLPASYSKRWPSEMPWKKWWISQVWTLLETFNNSTKYTMLCRNITYYFNFQLYCPNRGKSSWGQVNHTYMNIRHVRRRCIKVKQTTQTHLKCALCQTAGLQSFNPPYSGETFSPLQFHLVVPWVNWGCKSNGSVEYHCDPPASRSLLPEYVNIKYDMRYMVVLANHWECKIKEMNYSHWSQ